MVNDQNKVERARAIVRLLPGKNCGKCGFENCGKFAVAAVSGEASPFGCRQDSSTGDAICRILGIEAAKRNSAAAAMPGNPENDQGRRHGHGHGHTDGHGGHHGDGHGLGHHGHHRILL